MQNQDKVAVGSRPASNPLWLGNVPIRVFGRIKFHGINALFLNATVLDRLIWI